MDRRIDRKVDRYMVPCRRVDTPPPNGMVPPPTLNPKP